MIPTSAAFKKALAYSHQDVIYAEVWRGTELLTPGGIPVDGGSVSVDSNSLIQRRCSLIIPGRADLIPGRTGGTLWPMGQEIKVRAGVQFVDGTQETFGLGVFRIAKPVVNEDADYNVTISIDSYDRGRRVSRARFTTTYVVADDSDLATAIRNILEPRLPPDVVFNFVDTTVNGLTTPRLVFAAGDDPWQKCQEMASSGGLELFFDGDGNPVLREIPDPAVDDPVWNYVEGDTANLMEPPLQRDLDDEQAYNGCIATSESTATGALVRGEYWDTDINSPTYYDPQNPDASIYGPVPTFLTSPYIKTQAQADAAARGEYLRSRGVLETLSLTSVAVYAHEQSDLVRLKRSRLGVDGLYSLDSFTLPLVPGDAMTATTRSTPAWVG